ncbi:SDR family oxidoreductase [Deinococcus frigens]|uniref:SDR family oxidoreductase n=1 Tax=Deinococcus frigens TaxID=249403 RepID=UPI00054D25DF|nr:NmrA family NAD(P)-binding protein [Deinococcus frigens]
MSELVLTYGAGGAQGAPVAHGLLDAGYRVRALVTDAAKNQALNDAGAEVVAGDLADMDSVRRATQGVDKVFLMLPFSGGGNPLEYAQNAIQAAKEGGVKLLVLNTSGQTPPEPTGLPMMDYRIHLERGLRDSGVPNIILRPTAYMENFLGPWVLPRLQAEDVLAYPVAADRPTSWIAAQDLGRFAVAALGRPELTGQAFDLGGPQALKGADIADAFSTALGREIRYEATTPEQFGAIMGRMMGPEAEAGIVAAYRAGAAAPLDSMVVDMQGVVAQLPVQQTTLEQWVRQQVDLFAQTAQA